MTRKEVLSILFQMDLDHNKDGTGEVYIQDGKFVLNKYALKVTNVLKRKLPFLNHLPHNGWTIVHIRNASCGHVCRENAHPFVIENTWAVAHNGTWFDAKWARWGMESFVQFFGNTDSEVAANMINKVGIKNFSDEVEWGGVYLCLNIDGSLSVIKNSGELSISKLANDTCVIASELPFDKYPQVEAIRGYYVFNADGTYRFHREKKWSYWKPTKHIGQYFSYIPPKGQHGKHFNGIITTVPNRLIGGFRGNGMDGLEESDLSLSDRHATARKLPDNLSDRFGRVIRDEDIWSGCLGDI